MPGKKDLEAYTETRERRLHRVNSDLRGMSRAVALREQRYTVLLKKDSVYKGLPQKRREGWDGITGVSHGLRGLRTIPRLWDNSLHSPGFRGKHLPWGRGVPGQRYCAPPFHLGL